MPTKNSQKPGAHAAVASAPEPAWYWTWGGASFGYREGDGLFTHDGLEVGRFAGREIYGPDGRYLGECGSGKDAARLITNTHKISMAGTPFVPTLGRAHRKRSDRPGLPLYSGHIDFPLPQTVRSTLSGMRAYAGAPA